ncbi:MAG TPA: hypothetical protein PLP58_22260 [Prosthecobacter sp.]|nr:hypothetical protein [Prosthecobacter sp.]
MKRLFRWSILAAAIALPLAAALVWGCDAWLGVPESEGVHARR